jgi:hypothetical protein
MRNVSFGGALILVGIILGVWFGRPHEPARDLGAAPEQYVSSGTLKAIDNSGVDLADLGIDLAPSLDVPLRVDLNNGPGGYLGWYAIVDQSVMLNLSAPRQGDAATDSIGNLMLYLPPWNAPSLESKPPAQSKIDIPVKDDKPSRFSTKWWLDLVFSRKSRSNTLHAELGSEDSRLVRRDGKPFAVCGHDRDGSAAIVFVSPDYAPTARISFRPIRGNSTSLAFEILSRDGHSIALLSTESPRGPQLSFAGVDRSSSTGEALFDLDPTGTKLVDLKLGTAGGGVVDWLSQQMYRAQLPIRLIDATGKVIWSTGKAVSP